MDVMIFADEAEAGEVFYPIDFDDICSGKFDEVGVDVLGDL